MELQGTGNVFTVEELLLNRGVVVEEVNVSELDLSDRTFATHDEADDDASPLEDSLQADGQLDPIVVRRCDGRWQVVDGFRRVRAALHLGWHKVKARRFDALPAEQAALWAVKNITAQLPYPHALEALAARLEHAGEITAGDVVRRYAESIEVTHEDAPAAAAPDDTQTDATQTDEEVTLEALAEQTLSTFAAQSENMQLLQENWTDVPEETREALRQHLRYYAELLSFLEEPQDVEQS